MRPIRPKGSPRAAEVLARMAAGIVQPRPEQLAGETAEAERQLYTFLQQAWHVIEPTTPYVDGWHIGCVCEHLQAVTELEIRNLIISLPPRHCKSILSGQVWMPWVWLRDPGSRWLFQSYGENLVFRDADKSRSIIQSPWYTVRWGHVFHLRRDLGSLGKFSNDRHGYRISTTIGGKAGGEGGDYLCFPAGVRVPTAAGSQPIERIETGWPVVSFSHHAGRLVLRRVVRVYVSHGCRSIVVILGRGVLPCTPNHPVYVVGVGYVPASELKPGDRIIRHAQAVHDLWNDGKSLCGSHETKSSCLLQPRLPRQVADWSAESSMERRHGHADVLRVSEALCGQAMRDWSAVGDVVFSRLCRQSEDWPATVFARLEKMRTVSDHVAADAGESASEAFLFAAVPGAFSPRLSQWCQEPALRSRRRSRRTSGGLQEDSADDFEARPAAVPGVHLPRNATASSSRPRQIQQRANKSDCFMFSVPSADAWAGNCGLETDTVLAVENRSGPAGEKFFNLAVEGENNYFAEGVLVHNCWDDPLKPSDAMSEAKRGHVNSTWTNTAIFRGNNPKTFRKVIIHHRLHSRDLTGYLLAERHNYEHLCLAAEHEPARMLPPAWLSEPDVDEKATKIRDAIKPTTLQIRRPELLDKRTQHGDLLWPERFDEASIEELKAEAETSWAGQGQQRPAPQQGSIFNSSYFRHFRIEEMERGLAAVLGTDDNPDAPAPRIVLATCRWFQTADTSLGEDPRSAYTAVSTFAWSRATGDLLIWDIWRMRLEAPEQFDALMELRNGRPTFDLRSRVWTVRGLERPWPCPIMFQAVEKASTGQGIIQLGRRDSKPFVELNPGGENKIQRAAAVATLYRNGKVWHRAGGGWVPDCEDELLTFPRGAFKDQVDTIAWAGRLAVMDQILNADIPENLVIYPDDKRIKDRRAQPLPGDHDPVERINIAGMEIDFDDRPEGWR